MNPTAVLFYLDAAVALDFSSPKKATTTSFQAFQELSVCLFHVKFGGPCRQVDFEDIRPSNGNSSRVYNTSILNGWVDEVDRPVPWNERCFFGVLGGGFWLKLSQAT